MRNFHCRRPLIRACGRTRIRNVVPLLQYPVVSRPGKPCAPDGTPAFFKRLSFAVSKVVALRLDCVTWRDFQLLHE